MRLKETVRARERERVREKSQSEREGESNLQSKKILDGVLLDAKNAWPSIVSDRSGIFLNSRWWNKVMQFIGRCHLKKDGRIDGLGVECSCVSGMKGG